MKKISLMDPYISLKLGETFTNKGPRKDVQVLFYNAVGIRSTSFRTLETGESITKTHSDTIIHIFLT